MSKNFNLKNYFSKEIISTISFILLIFIAAIIFNTIKDSSPNNQTKEIIQKQENTFWDSINLWILISGIVGIIGFLFFVYKLVKWVINEFNSSSNLPSITA